MFVKATKLLASALVLTMLFTTTGVSAFASGNDKKQTKPTTTTTTQTTTPPTAQPTTGTVQEMPAGDKLGDQQPQYGIRSYLLRLALGAVATGIRHGGAYLADIVGALSPEAEVVFSRYSYRIADKLDYISTWSTLAEESIRSFLFNFLWKDLGVKSGIAMEIASVVASIVSIAAL